MKKKAIVAWILGLAAGAALGVQQMTALTPEMESQIGSKSVVVVVAMLQTAVMACIAAIVGAWAAPKVNLDKPFVFRKNSIVAALVIGLVSAGIIAVPEKLVFAEALGLEDQYQFSWLYFVGSVLYGGIIEEVLLRFGLMSLVVWAAGKMTKSADKSGIYIAGIVIAALVFAAGHLPATAQMMGLSTMAVVRTMLLNVLPGIGFGYLYWKHGLGYAMMAHISTHVFNQLILLPLLF